jgi:competence protein ComEC
MKRLFTGLLFLLSSLTTSAQDENKMTAHFINVGQGDATLLEFPCGAMLIDAGAQGIPEEKKLVKYLQQFFQRRTDLNNTLDLVIITHAHVDHNLALDTISTLFTIKRYIDNGKQNGSGRYNQVRMQQLAKDKKIPYRSYSFSKITSAGTGQGYSDTIIDPLACSEVDPEIVLLSGTFTSKPAGWTEEDFKNGNNHSVVVKVSFGESSFLFTGDLETKGINKLLSTYDASVLDVDILRVGHHGASNATTPEYLQAVTPEYAVISCGKWNFGKNASSKFTTYAYGHPRINILDQLAMYVTGNRSEDVYVRAGRAARDFTGYTIQKRIYATPWDGNLCITATAGGSYRATRNN